MLDFEAQRLHIEKKKDKVEDDRNHHSVSIFFYPDNTTKRTLSTLPEKNELTVVQRLD